MSQARNIWLQLVQRRLWPLALVLAAALVAVPLLVAKDPEPVGAPVVAPVTGKDELATQPIVALAGAEDRARRRRVLGKPKNPFAVVTPVPAAPVATATPDPTPDAAPAGGTEAGGTDAGGGTTAPATPAPEEPATRTYSMHELTVRFGTEEGGELQSLERLQPLPSTEAPVLIYLGALDDGKVAVFLLDKGLTAVGDGRCKPSPGQCETLRMRAGETEFFDVVDETGAVTAQYQLDLIKIHKRTTASVSRANVSSKRGRRLLKARVAADGPTGYRWNAAAAALERRPERSLRATVADSGAALR
jgi:hypothetical protein